MTGIHHLNCGTIVVPSYPTVVCHCLLLEDAGGLALVDSGIGLLDVRRPVERLGQQLVDAAGFQFHESDTAVKRIERLGLDPSQVRHIVLTHCDPDHAGGLADFPQAQVHLAAEELENLRSGNPRYVPAQFEHRPRWTTYAAETDRWFGLESRRVELGFSSDILLVPLRGHTHGHCGVAIEQNGRWLLHAGDAYYLRAELIDQNHPVSALAAQRADDDARRHKTLLELQRLSREHGNEIELFGYHDISEIPADCLER